MTNKLFLVIKCDKFDERFLRKIVTIKLKWFIRVSIKMEKQLNWKMLCVLKSSKIETNKDQLVDLEENVVKLEVFQWLGQGFFIILRNKIL